MALGSSILVTGSVDVSDQVPATEATLLVTSIGYSRPIAATRRYLIGGGDVPDFRARPRTRNVSQHQIGRCTLTSVRPPLLAFVLLVGLFAATAAPIAGAGPTAVPSPPAAGPSAGAGASTLVLRAYFLLRDPAGGDPKLVPVLRQVPATTGTATAALRQLLAGPSAAEASASPRIISVIPEGDHAARRPDQLGAWPP